MLCAQEPRLVLPVGHTSIVSCAAYSPDGKTVATGSWDNTAKIWEVSGGRLLFDLRGHTGTVNSIAFSPDGKRILTASKDHSAKIWDAATGQLIYDLKAHTDWVSTAVFSADGKHIVTASWDSTAKIWDAGTGKVLISLKGHRGPVSAAVFSPDGRLLVTGSRDGTAKIWDPNSGQILFDLKSHRRAVLAAIYSGDGRLIATASSDSTVMIWQASDGKRLFELKNHQGPVRSIAFSPDGKQIATASADHLVRIWSVLHGRLLFELKGHTAPVNTVVFDRGSKYLLSASEDSTAKIWDLSTGDLMQTLQGHSNWVNAAIFSPSGNHVLTVSSDNTAKIWRVADGREIAMLKGHVALTASASFSPDGKYIVTVCYDSTAKIWDNASGHLTATLGRDINWMSAMAFSPDNKYVALSSFDHTVAFYQLQDGQIVRTLKGHDDWISSISISHDGQRAVTASWDSTVKIWNAADGRLLRSIETGSGLIRSAEFSPNDRSIVVASGDKTAGVWSAGTGRLLFGLIGHRGEVRTAQFSRDGKFIATASWDGTARIWAADNGRLLHVLKGHRGFVNAAVFSQDGHYLVTCSMDSTARVWDTQKGQLVCILKGHSGPVLAVAFSRKGDEVFSASWDGTARVWGIPGARLLQVMKSGSAAVSSLSVSPDEKDLLTASEDHTLKKWDTKTGALRYAFFAVDSNDYLLTDPDGRYDGTQAARNRLYYLCGTEPIDLEQFKNMCWEPGLASKLNGFDPEPISARKMSEINICGYAPFVEEKKSEDSFFCFGIKGGRGGIGKVRIFVNGKLIRECDTMSLQRQGDRYLLRVNKKEAGAYFVSGEDNQVSVKAITCDGAMQSRGTLFIAPGEHIAHLRPDMYILSIGISDYKGQGLKLNYASKDAVDFSTALIGSAKKLLNSDGSARVFAYTFTTEKNGRWPAKEEIAKAVDTIAQRARPDDIFVAFFAGHGLLLPEHKDFYLLTAEASDFNVSGVEKQVAISTGELDAWSRKIRANKQVVILDACSSGQVIRNLEQLMRGDLPADQQRALENLRDGTGIFILSASESGQSARESSYYDQGLLTFSLLSGIKFGNGLRDGKFIDVGRWFSFASENVKILAQDIGARQDPQVLGTASFDIGMVDNDIADSIRLPLRKKVFGHSLLISDDQLVTDELGLSQIVDRSLSNLSDYGKESPLVFIPDNIFPESFAVHGRYGLTGNMIQAKISLIRSQKEKIYQFDISGYADKKDELAARIVERLRQYMINAN